MKNFKKLFLAYSLIAFSNLNAQEPLEIPIEEQRDNKIKALSEIVKINKDIYVSEDRVRLNKFINLVEERENFFSLQNYNLKMRKLEIKN